MMRYLLASFLFLSSAGYSLNIELQNSSIDDFVGWAASYLNKTIVVGTDLETLVTVYAEYENDAELENLLVSIVVSAGYHIDITEKYIIISEERLPENYGLIESASSSENNNVSSMNPFQYDEPEDVIYRNFQLQNLDSFAFHTILKGLFPSDDVINVQESNSVIVFLSEENLSTAELLYSEMDMAIRQVVIEAVIAEVSKDDLFLFGSDLLIGSQNYFQTDLAGDVIQSGVTAALNIVSPSNLDLFISMVDRSNSSNILSSPKITVLNRREGYIHVGQNVPFLTGIQASSSDTNAVPVQNIERRDVGVTLRISPLILPNGTVQLDVYQEVSNVSDSIQASDIITNERNMSSTLIIEDGRSVYLGGLKSTSDQETVRKVPLLSSIPILGNLFKSTTHTNEERVLAVILTAHII